MTAAGAEAIGNPWATIWTTPRATIRRIVDVNVRYQVIFLAMLSGALARLELQWSQPPRGGIWPLLVAGSVVFGAVMGIVALYLAGALLKWSGAVLGGVATYAEVRAALAWARVPIIVAVAIGILSILIGNGGPAIPLAAATHESSIAISLLHGVLGIWGFVVMLKCVGEVHRFSAWRALGSILLVTVAIMIIAAATVLSFGGVEKVVHPIFSV